MEPRRNPLCSAKRKSNGSELKTLPMIKLHLDALSQDELQNVFRFRSARPRAENRAELFHIVQYYRFFNLADGTCMQVEVCYENCELPASLFCIIVTPLTVEKLNSP